MKKRKKEEEVLGKREFRQEGLWRKDFRKELFAQAKGVWRGKSQERGFSRSSGRGLLQSLPGTILKKPLMAKAVKWETRNLFSSTRSLKWIRSLKSSRVFWM